MTCWRNVSTGGKPTKKKNGTLRCRFLWARGWLLRHRLDELLVGLRLAALNDRDRLDLAALHREDGHLRVLAVALLVEGDLPGRAGEVDLLQLGQVSLRIRRVGLLHGFDQQVRRVIGE